MHINKAQKWCEKRVTPCAMLMRVGLPVVRPKLGEAGESSAGKLLGVGAKLFAPGRSDVTANG